MVLIEEYSVQRACNSNGKNNLPQRWVMESAELGLCPTTRQMASPLQPMRLRSKDQCRVECPLCFISIRDLFSSAFCILTSAFKKKPRSFGPGFLAHNGNVQLSLASDFCCPLRRFQLDCLRSFCCYRLSRCCSRSFSFFARNQCIELAS